MPSMTVKKTIGAKIRVAREMSADTVFSVANWLLLAALIMGVMATYAIIASGNIKEDNLKRELAAAHERTETLRKANLSLQENVEHERIERLRLQAIVAPRNLTLDQQREIADALRGFAGKTVSITTYSLDTDAAMLAEQIIACLKVAGINPDNQIASEMPLGGFSIGIHVSGKDQKLVNELAIALAKRGQAVAPPNTAQQGAGMSLGVRNSPDASILIGAKPLLKIQ